MPQREGVSLDITVVILYNSLTSVLQQEPVIAKDGIGSLIGPDQLRRFRMALTTVSTSSVELIRLGASLAYCVA